MSSAIDSASDVSSEFDLQRLKDSRLGWSDVRLSQDVQARLTYLAADHPRRSGIASMSVKSSVHTCLQLEMIWQP